METIQVWKPNVAKQWAKGKGTLEDKKFIVIKEWTEPGAVTVGDHYKVKIGRKVYEDTIARAPQQGEVARFEIVE